MHTCLSVWLVLLCAPSAHNAVKSSDQPGRFGEESNPTRLGKTREPEVSHPVLAEAAAAAIMRWRYQAGPRETTESVKISFGK